MTAMSESRNLLVTTICLLFLITSAYAGQKTNPSGICIFDDLVTKELITSGCKTSIPSKFTTANIEVGKVYSIIFQFSGRRRDDYFMCTVTIAHSGKLLDPQRYEELYQAEKQEAFKRGKEYYDFYFPRIGKRALIDDIRFGPGGGGFSLTFTTSDECYDVRVEQSELLSIGIDEPKIDIHKIAKKISELYDKKVQNKAHSPCH